MADDETPVAPAQEDPPAGLGDAGKKALDEERRKRRDAEKALSEMKAQLTELQDRDKSEVDKLREQVDAMSKDREAAVQRAMRLEVATAKGLTPAQAKRLVGSTVEELEADAAEIIEAFQGKGSPTPPPPTKPTPDLRGGSDPTGPVDADIASIVASIPRS